MTVLQAAQLCKAANSNSRSLSKTRRVALANQWPLNIICAKLASALQQNIFKAARSCLFSLTPRSKNRIRSTQTETSLGISRLAIATPCFGRKSPDTLWPPYQRSCGNAPPQKHLKRLIVPLPILCLFPAPSYRLYCLLFSLGTGFLTSGEDHMDEDMSPSFSAKGFILDWEHGLVGGERTEIGSGGMFVGRRNVFFVESDSYANAFPCCASSGRGNSMGLILEARSSLLFGSVAYGKRRSLLTVGT